MTPTPERGRLRTDLAIERELRERERESGEHPAVQQRPLGEVINDAWVKAELLMRQEIQLGVVDTERRVQKLMRDFDRQLAQWKLDMAAKAAGGTMAFVGLLALVTAAILLLSKLISPWLSALSVGGVLLAIGAVLLSRKVRTPELHASELIPRRAIDSAQQDARAIKEAVK